MRLAYFEDWIDRIALEVLNGATDLVEPVRLSFSAPDDEIWEALKGVHGLQCRTKTELPEKWYATQDLIDRCPNLLALSSTGAGYDMIDVPACSERGILVVNNSGTNSVSVAQHVMGQMLTLSKQIAQADKAMRRVAEVDRFNFVGAELTDKTLGIIGLGNIGRRVAAYAQTFGMDVIAYDPYLEPVDFVERNARPAELGVLFRDADFISVNCPLTDETRAMIGAKAFKLMKPSAYFVTTARGGIVDEAALSAALKLGELRGAAVDVFEVEPTGAAHPLAAHENVLLSPHNAGVTEEANLNMARYGAEQWITIMKGGRPPRLINPEAWDRYIERFEWIVGRPVSSAVS